METLLKTIREVHNGEMPTGPELAAALLRDDRPRYVTGTTRLD